MSKRKGYSQAKRAQAVASAALKNLVLIYTPEFQGPILINPKAKKAVRPTTNTMRALLSIPHQWSILLCAFGKKDDGIYMRADEYHVTERVYHEEIQEAIIKAHDQLAEELGDEFHSVGYIAATRDWNWDANDAFNLFKEIGGI